MTEPEYIPTEEEIAAACEEIQKGWDEDTRLRRRYDTLENAEEFAKWMPPILNLRELDEIISAECGEEEM